MEDDRKVNAPPIQEEEEDEAKGKQEERLEKAMTELVGALRQRRPLAVIRAIVETRIAPLEAPNLFLARKDRERGWTPLHHAALGRSQLCAVKYLVATCPEAVRSKSKNGTLPLHIAANALAAARPRISKVSRVLVEAWPEALMEPSSQGWLPVHLALATCDNTVGGMMYRRPDDPTDFDTVRLMVRQAPQSLRVPGPDGKLPIHCLVGSGAARAELKTIKLVVDAYPDALLVRDGNGDLPVHLVNDCGPMQDEVDQFWLEAGEIMQFLVAKCPRSATEPAREAHNGTLLHLALTKWHWAFVNEINHVVQHCPGIVTIPDARGDLALHLAARQFHNEVAEFLVEQSPESVQARGYMGRLPIHGVADPTDDGRLFWDTYPCVSMLRCLEELCPESLLERDDNGKTPLHLAAGGRPIWTSGGTLSVVQCLVDACPDALGAADNEGRLPLHDALDWKDEDKEMSPQKLKEATSVVQFLIEKRPQALRVADMEGNLPLHAAVRRQVPPSVLCLLFSPSPSTQHSGPPSLKRARAG
jgi:ankyrin repeat protein